MRGDGEPQRGLNRGGTRLVSCYVEWTLPEAKGTGHVEMAVLVLTMIESTWCYRGDQGGRILGRSDHSMEEVLAGLPMWGSVEGGEALGLGSISWQSGPATG